MAQYPTAVPAFSTKTNVVTVVDASHPNSVQAEVTAMGLELGTTPRISTYRSPANGGPTGGAYADVATRLSGIENDYRLKTDHDTHGLLGGLAADDHPQYLRADGTRAPTGVGSMVANPIAVQVGDTISGGSANALARSDHRHSVADGTPGASAVADTAANGTAVTFARSDHRHAREGFGAVSTATAFGGAAANGTATTVARSDHNHGTPALGGTPVTQVVGDAATVGTSLTASPSDHRHGMPGFGAVTAETTFGIAAANGTAGTLARSDHTHGTPSLATTVTDERTWGISPAVGTSGNAAREDHTHGSPDATLTGPSGVVAMWPTATPPTGWLLCDGSTVSRTTYATLYGILGTTFGAGDGSTTFNLPDYRSRVVVGASDQNPVGGALGQVSATVALGAGRTARAKAATGGEETHVLTTGELASHQHTTPSHSHGGGVNYSDVVHAHSVSTESPTSSFMAANWNHSHVISGNQVGWAQGSHDHYSGVSNLAEGPRATGGSVGSPGKSSGTDVTNIDHQHGVTHGHTAGNTSINHSHTINGDAPTTNGTGSGTAHNNMQPWLALNFIIKY